MGEEKLFFEMCNELKMKNKRENYVSVRGCIYTVVAFVVRQTVFHVSRTKYTTDAICYMVWYIIFSCSETES